VVLQLGGWARAKKLLTVKMFLCYEIFTDEAWGIILSWIFRKWDVGLWTGFSWLRTGTGGGHL
jgi:hypothetical protein